MYKSHNVKIIGMFGAGTILYDQKLDDIINIYDEYPDVLAYMNVVAAMTRGNLF